MSEAIAFDTHRFVKRLTRTGFTEEQAEALADEQVALLNSNLATRENLLRLEGVQKQQLAEHEAAQKKQLAEHEAATEQKIQEIKRDIQEIKRDIQDMKGSQKRQLAELEGRQKQRMTELEGRLQRQMAELKADLLKWMIGALIAQTGVIAGLVLGFSGAGPAGP